METKPDAHPTAGHWRTAPEELQQSARRMAKLGGWEFLVDEGIVHWDEEVAAAHGLPGTRQLKVEEALAAYTPESRRRFERLLDACITTVASFDDEFDLLAPDGRHVWLRGIGSARRSGGRVTSIHGACQDVTERRQAQAHAEGLGVQLRATLESMSDAFVMLDSDFRIVYVNRAAALVAGRRASELLGRTLWECFPRALGTKYELETRRAMRERLPVTFEEQSRPPANRWLEVREFPSADGGLAIYFRDITKRKAGELERRTAEQRKSQAHKMESLGTLAGGIAHDFNNMLSAILANTGLALEHVDVDHPARAHLDNIRNASQRARELVRRILSFSRTETALTAARVQPLAPVVEEAMTLLRAIVPAGVELRTRLTDQLVSAAIDATSLQQVLLNLCTNAWQSLPDDKGFVEVGMEPLSIVGAAASPSLHDGHYAHLWVTDNGCGIDKATRQRLFEPFFTTKPRGQGTGLGLPAVLGIVEAHGGSMAVDSHPGEGSCFHVYLPLRTSPSGSETPASMPGPDRPGAGERVLLVDDDPVVLLAHEHLLRRLGYQVLPCADPTDALQLIARQPDAADVVVTDFSMPSMSGLDLAREISKRRADLPIILSSGYISDDVRRSAQGAGIRLLLHKENAFEELGGVVMQALRGASPSDGVEQ